MPPVVAERLRQHFEQRVAIGFGAVTVIEEAVPIREVLELGTRDAGVAPRHFLPRTAPRQRGEHGQAGLEELAVETSVVRDHDADGLEQLTDARVVDALAGDHRVGNAVNGGRRGRDRHARIFERVVGLEHASDGARDVAVLEPRRSRVR